MCGILFGEQNISEDGTDSGMLIVTITIRKRSVLLSVSILYLVFVHHKYILYKETTDATLAVLFISNCKITLHVSDTFCVHHQEY